MTGNSAVLGRKFCSGPAGLAAGALGGAVGGGWSGGAEAGFAAVESVAAESCQQGERHLHCGAKPPIEGLTGEKVGELVLEF